MIKYIKDGKIIKYLPVFGYIILFALLILVSQDFKMNRLFNGGDIWLQINPLRTIEKSIFMWEDSLLGRPQTMGPIYGLFALPLYVFFSITQQIYWASFLEYLLFFTIIPLSMYFLSLELTKNNILVSLIASFVYTFNLFSFMMYHTAVFHIIFIFAAGPFLILLLIKLYEDFDKINIINIKYIIMINIIFLFLLRVVNIFLMYLFFVPLLVLIIYANKINLRKFLVAFLIFTGTTLILASPIIFLNGLKLIDEEQIASVSLDYSNSALNIGYQYNLLDTIRGVRDNAANLEGYRGTANTYYFKSLFYETDPVNLLLSFTIVGACLLCMLRKEKRTIMFSGLMLICLFFAKMNNPPFSAINTFLLSNNIVLLLFRTGGKYFQFLLSLLYSLVLVYGLEEVYRLFERKKRVQCTLFIILTVVAIAFASVPFQATKLLNPTWFNSIPTEYEDVSQFLNRDKEEFKIIVLPITSHFAGYVSYNWNYTGPDILYHLVEHPLIDKFHNAVASDEYITWLNNLSTTKSPEVIFNIIEDSNIKYIIIRKDLDDEDSIQRRLFAPTWDENEINSFLEYGINQSRIILVKGTELLDVYLVETYSPIIEINGQLVEYSKRNPTSYYVKLGGEIEANSTIIFRQEYNKGWILSCDNKNEVTTRYGLFNSWKIPSGNCREVKIYFVYQQIFLILSVITISCYVIIILYFYLKSIKSKRSS